MSNRANVSYYMLSIYRNENILSLEASIHILSIIIQQTVQHYLWRNIYLLIFLYLLYHITLKTSRLKKFPLLLTKYKIVLRLYSNAG